MPSNAWSLFKKGHRHVQISNKLPGNAELTVHCKSGNKDLGAHTVGANQFYDFPFSVNFFATTLYFCGLHWRGGNVVDDFFIAYRDEGRCWELCYWEARADGVYGV